MSNASQYNVTIVPRFNGTRNPQIAEGQASSVQGALRAALLHLADWWDVDPVRTLRLRDYEWTEAMLDGNATGRWRDEVTSPWGNLTIRFEAEREA